MKTILKNEQMRNIIYLFLGLIVSLIIFITYKPYKKSLKIVDEEDVKTLEKSSFAYILEEYKNTLYFSYTIYYDEYVISGIYNGAFIDNNQIEEIREFENFIRPDNLYNILSDKEYQDEYVIGNNIVKLKIEDEKIKKIIVNDITIEYGG